jgi:hypothetical protein
MLTITTPTIPQTNGTAPALNGTAVLGGSLSCSVGSWTGDPAPTYTYQWLRDGTAIASATSASYALQRIDCAQKLSCRVTATNCAGQASKTSSSLTVRAAPDLVLRLSARRLTVGRNVTISGTVRNFLSTARTVCVCRKQSGKLVMLKRITVSGSGAYRWKMKAGKVGRWVLVAVYKAAHVTFQSKAVTLTVRG